MTVHAVTDVRSALRQLSFQHDTRWRMHRGDGRERAEGRPPGLPSSIKGMRKRAKVAKINVFRTLEMNKRLAATSWVLALDPRVLNAVVHVFLNRLPEICGNRLSSEIPFLFLLCIKTNEQRITTADAEALSVLAFFSPSPSSRGCWLTSSLLTALSNIPSRDVFKTANKSFSSCSKICLLSGVTLISTHSKAKKKGNLLCLNSASTIEVSPPISFTCTD